LLSDDELIVMVGLKRNQIKKLPANIIGIERTNSLQELAALYSMADIFMNLTYEDNFPTTNIEALACGTPVITYKAGGSPEIISDKTGFSVERGDVNKALSHARSIFASGKNSYSGSCRTRAEQLYDKNDRFKDYLSLYKTLLSGKEI
jgi:glycosyltransferase involved in cell wall biosynthesis